VEYIKSFDGTRLGVRQWIPAAPPKAAVLIVHGLGEHSGRYGFVAGSFNDRGYAVGAFDLRGHGNSEGKRGHCPSYEHLMEDFDAALKWILQSLGGAGAPLPIFLYGHSLGGNLVLNYLLRRRPAVTGAIVTGPWLTLATEPPAYKIILAGIMNRVCPSMTQSNGIDGSKLSHDKESNSRYDGDPLVHNRISSRMYLEVKDAGRWALDNKAIPNVPLLIMHGAEDSVTSPLSSAAFARKAADAGAFCTLRLWDGLCHELHNETGRKDVMDFAIDWADALL
jgi:alpha-beta hydrolase superfamily lysophospholipase